MAAPRCDRCKSFGHTDTTCPMTLIWQEKQTQPTEDAPLAGTPPTNPVGSTLQPSPEIAPPTDPPPQPIHVDSNPKTPPEIALSPDPHPEPAQCTEAETCTNTVHAVQIQHTQYPIPVILLSAACPQRRISSPRQRTAIAPSAPPPTPGLTASLDQIHKPVPELSPVPPAPSEIPPVRQVITEPNTSIIPTPPPDLASSSTSTSPLNTVSHTESAMSSSAAPTPTADLKPVLQDSPPGIVLKVDLTPRLLPEPPSTALPEPIHVPKSAISPPDRISAKNPEWTQAETAAARNQLGRKPIKIHPPKPAQLSPPKRTLRSSTRGHSTS